MFEKGKTKELEILNFEKKEVFILSKHLKTQFYPRASILYSKHYKEDVWKKTAVVPWNLQSRKFS